MKLSRIILLVGLSSLALSGLMLWHKSSAVPTRQAYQASAIVPPTAIASSPISPAPVVPVQPIVPVSTAPIQRTDSKIVPHPTAPIPLRAAAAQANFQIITACNDHPGNGNFRSAPSLAPGAILGVVAQGEAVALTGRTTIGDEEFWYEAIAPASLHPSTDPDARNQTQAGQTGWVAACFINR